MDTVVCVEKHQFAFADRGRPFTDWSNADWHAIGLGAGEGRLTLFTERATGYVPLSITIADRDPALDLDRWSRVVLAHWTCSSGYAELVELYGKSRPTVEIPAGDYRVLACSGDLDSAEPDGSTGADHYQLILWPGSAVAAQVIKPYRSLSRERRSPALSLERCAELAASGDRHDRFHALPELARHGTDDAVESIHAIARAGDVINRIAAIGALGVGLPIRIDQLERYAGDDDARARSAVLGVLHKAMLDFEFENTDALDTDVAYRVLNRLANDPDRGIGGLVSRLLTALDGLAERAAP